MVQGHFSLILPPFLANYAQGRLISNAWDEKSWLRVLTQMRPVTQSAEIDTISTQDLSVKYPEKITLPTEQHTNNSAELFRLIKQAFHRRQGAPEPSFKKLQESIKKIKPTIKQGHILIYCLLIWVNERVKKKEIRRSTAYQQLTSIGRDLLSNFEQEELSQLDPEEYIEKYENILENTPSAITRSNKASLLQRFHNFLVEAVDAPPIRFALEDQQFFAVPNTNILLEKEYLQIFAWLKEHKHDSPMQHAQLIVFLLAYRCGLRISEIQNLQLEDVQYIGMLKNLKVTPDTIGLGQIPVTLLIRPNQHNKLKSSSSKRQINLNQFLTEEEINELLLYHQRQLNKLASPSGKAFLFSTNKNNASPMNFNEVTLGLQNLMRHLTGDPKISMHHLRHTLANKLFQVDLGMDGPLEISPHLEQKETMPSRKKLFAISNTLGHANPSVSTHHYIHSLDLLLRQKLWCHSFAHQNTGFGAKQKFILNNNTSACVGKLMGLQPGNVRAHNSHYGTLLRYSHFWCMR